jgi:site-specific DNA-methyltransferase (adenine-specific)
MKTILVINALNGVLPLVLQTKYPSATITCAEIFPFYKHHLRNLGFDVVDWETMGDMKFDIIIGNPPYQNSNKSSDKLWPHFASKSFDMINPDGYVALVTPNGWFTKPDGQKFKKMTTTFAQMQPKVINLDGSQYFPEVGESIGWWVVKNCKNTHPARIVKDGVSYDLAWTGAKLALTDDDKMVEQIVAKVHGHSTTFDFYTDFKTDVNTKDLLAQGLIVKQATKVKSTPVFWSASQQMYCKPDQIRSGWKVIINRSGYYYSKTDPNKYITYNNTHGVGQLAFGIKYKTKKECINTVSYLTSSLYVWYVNSTKTNGWNDSVRRLPMLDSTRSWTDQMVYSEFGLTDAEIAYVENSV